MIACAFPLGVCFHHRHYRTKETHIYTRTHNRIRTSASMFRFAGMIKHIFGILSPVSLQQPNLFAAFLPLSLVFLIHTFHSSVARATRHHARRVTTLFPPHVAQSCVMFLRRLYHTKVVLTNPCSITCVHTHMIEEIFPHSIWQSNNIRSVLITESDFAQQYCTYTLRTEKIYSRKSHEAKICALF